MAKKSFPGLPYPPMERLDLDRPVRPADLEPILASRPGGVSLCVRSAAGHKNRGGYFFHVARSDATPEKYVLADFSRRKLKDAKKQEITFGVEELCELINHCSGLDFSERYLLLFQRELNFRSDSDEDDI